VTYEVPRMLTKGRAYFVDAGERLRLDCQFHMETFNLFNFQPVLAWVSRHACQGLENFAARSRPGSRHLCVKV